MFKTNIIGTFSSHLSKKHGVLAFECIKHEYRGKCKEGQSDDNIENEADCSAVTTADDCMDASCTTINMDDPNCTDDVAEMLLRLILSTKYHYSSLKWSVFMGYQGLPCRTSYRI